MDRTYNFSDEFDIQDTEKGFSNLSDKQLKHEILLFTLLNSPILSATLKTLVRLCLWLGIDITSLMKRTVFGHFCGGESVEECELTMANLFKNGVSTILDYSKESGTVEQTFDDTTNELIKVLNFAVKDKRIAFGVFKFSGLAEFDLLGKISIDELSQVDLVKLDALKQRIGKLGRLAFEAKIPLLVDAEQYSIQNAIDTLTEEMMEQFNGNDFVIYNTIQLYRTDRLEFMKAQHQRLKAKKIRSAFKLVRGAYMSYERDRALTEGYDSPIYATKQETDKCFADALKYCIENKDTIAICVGTHNVDSILLLRKLMKDAHMRADDPRVVFSQLLGMSDNVSNNLAFLGYNVAKYVPYGKVEEVIPYLLRRADENTSVLGEANRELVIRKNERTRRLNKKRL